MEQNKLVTQEDLFDPILDISSLPSVGFVLFSIAVVIVAIGYVIIQGADAYINNVELKKKRKDFIVALQVIGFVILMNSIISGFGYAFSDGSCVNPKCTIDMVMAETFFPPCVPNPQYEVSDEIYRERQNNSLGDVVEDLTGEKSTETQCCPNLIADVLTTGWAKGTDHFGDFDYKICCIYGDADGDQICD